MLISMILQEWLGMVVFVTASIKVLEMVDWDETQIIQFHEAMYIVYCETSSPNLKYICVCVNSNSVYITSIHYCHLFSLTYTKL